MAHDGYWKDTALHVAARASTVPQVIKVLVDAGAEVDMHNGRDETPLQAALGFANRGEPAVIEALLDAGANPNTRDSTDWTPLHTAAVEAEDARVIESLVAAGANLKARTRGTFHRVGGETPLHIAVANGAAPAAIVALLEAGADVSARDDAGYTPLHGAKEAVVAILLDAGADADARSEPGFSPLHRLAGSGPAVIEDLLTAGADIHARDEAGATPLHFVARHSDSVAEAELLLDAGADPKARDEDAATPLHYLAQGKANPEVLEALLMLGADIDARDEDGQTPLYHAAANNDNPAAFQTLLAAGADLSIRDNDGHTLLHAAASGENSAVIDALVAAGAEVNARAADDETPLHVAGRYSGWVECCLPSPIGLHPGPVYESTEVIEALLAAGAVVDARDSDGWTPLHWAARLNKNPTVIAALLAAGADADARTHAGETPLNLASSRLPLEIREVLRAHPLPTRPEGTDVENGTGFRDCPTCPEMLVVPAGNYRMGCVFSRNACWSDANLPTHDVDVASFALSKFEVTREQFAAFVAVSGYEVSGGCRYESGSWRDQSWQGDDHPVVCVGWDDAQAYVHWLSEETGYRYRLPTEAEWEHAIRAGTKTRFYWGYRDSDGCEYENTGKGSGSCSSEWERTAPVGSFRTNGFGLYDMAGNVSEWVQDCWHENYEGAPRDGSAWIHGGDCASRVVRGGSWGSGLGRGNRSAHRDGSESGFRWIRLGFRVARAIGPREAVQNRQ